MVICCVLVGALDKVIRGDEVGYSDKPKAKDFRKFFPNFLWVIRDVTLACTLRRGGKLVEVGMNEYVLKEVLNIENDDRENDKIKERNRLRKALLTSFPAFYSMKLSLPATDPSIMAVMNEGETRKRLSKPFLDGIEEFVSRCESLMKSKKAWPYVGNITGYNFAGLIRQYTYELAFDGTELCMQTIGKKVMEEMLGKIEGTAFIEYCNEMGNFAESALPCPSHEIFNKHNEYFFIALKTFKTNSKYINDVDMLNEYRHNLEERICVFGEEHHIIIGGYLNGILRDNIQKSDAFCKQLAMDLVKEKLDPLLKSSGGSRSPVNLNTEIQLVEKLYKEQARGPQVLHVYKTVLAEEKEKFRQQILNMKQKVEEDIRKAMREDVTRQQKQSKADYEERSAAIAFQVKELLQIHSGLAKELMSINKELIKEHHISMEELNKKMEKITLVH
ncbi:guanylate-binding protein 2-like [Ptychodera flava]|uniref:guanylate-binding protein 2-like n=1 Tax=Ptychodera flava TaxID=63121 RepID=UPI00396A7EFA